MRRPEFQAFGLRLVTDLALPGQWVTPRVLANRELELALDASIPEALPGAVIEWAAPIDGGHFTMERGADGAVLFRHETGRHLLSADMRRLRCAPADEADLGWFRVLLDSVLLCTALLGGGEGLHAGCVVVEGAAAAIVARTGAGKSTLVSELVGRGHDLLADDITMLDQTAADPPLALPGPPVMTVAVGTLQPPGEVLMELPGERWVTAAVADAPAPLRAIIVLERGAGASTAMADRGDAATVLLGALLALPKTPERALSRLDLASKLATRCRILTLTADLSAAPARLAELVEGAILGV